MALTDQQLQDAVIEILKIIGVSRLPSQLQNIPALPSKEHFLHIQKGEADGQRINVEQLRGYAGTYDPALNEPAISNATGVEGTYFIVAADGVRDFGNGQVSLSADDILEFKGGRWKTSLTLPDQLSETHVIDLGEIGLTSVETAFNDFHNQNPVEVQSTSEGLTIISALRNGAATRWIFTGKSGVYDEATPVTADDFFSGGDGSDNGNSVSLVDNLTSTSVVDALTANQGRVLKGFIDSINTLLNSDDTTLDELQEIVNFIKLNRTDLENLGIANIAGLADALASKADALHDHDERYIQTELDPTVPAHVKTIANTDILAWNSAVAKIITSIAITGTNTKTITITLADGTTVTGSFSDMVGEAGASDGNDYVNNSTWDGETLTLTLNRTDGGSVTRVLSHVHSFASLTGKPTTIAGYGITDAFTQALADQRYLQSESDPKGIASVNVTGTTTKTITITRNDGTTAMATFTESLSAMSLTELQTGTVTTARSIAAKTLADWITSKNYLTAVTWGIITGKPTTLAGYGITDALTQAAADLRYALASHAHTFASLTGKPTTIAGYGITDAFTQALADQRYLQSESDPKGVDSIAVTGTTTKTITITRNDGSTATATFTDLNTGTTYSLITAAALTAGTETAERLVSAKLLHDWLLSKNYLTSVAWGIITGKPTTISGYGITDAEKKRTIKNVDNTSQYTVVAADFTDFILDFTANAGQTISVILNTGVAPAVGQIQMISSGNHILDVVAGTGVAITKPENTTYKSVGKGSWLGIMKLDAPNTFALNGSLESTEEPLTSVSWADVTGKPSTFTPSSHTHAIFTNTANGFVPAPNVSGGGGSGFGGEITFPAEGATITQGQEITVTASHSENTSYSGEITFPSEGAVLQQGVEVTVTASYSGSGGASTGKRYLDENGNWTEVETPSAVINWSEVQEKPLTFPPSTHSHAWGDITGKPTTFPPSTHNHDSSYIAKSTGIQNLVVLTQAEYDAIATKASTTIYFIK